MDFSHLKTLIHVAELGSFSKAAERLNIAQPALSRQIRQLEAELKSPLFTRHGRGVTLTELGRRVLGPANAALEQIATIRRLANDGQSEFVGRVRFGMTPTVSEVMTVPLAQRIMEAQPQMSLCLTSAFSGHILDWLKRELLDCCVTYDPETIGAVRTRPILVERLLLVGNASRGFGMECPVPFATLAREPLILPSPLHGLRRIIDEFAARAGVRLTPVLEADSFSGMIDLVRSGFGITVLPLAPIYDRVARGELTAAPLVDPEPTRTVAITYPSDRPVSAAARYVGDVFSTIAAELIAQGVWAGRVIQPGGSVASHAGSA